MCVRASDRFASLQQAGASGLAPSVLVDAGPDAGATAALGYPTVSHTQL
jgi:hypothetical protein